MIKLETHAHSFGGSYCATSPNEVLVDTYVKAGYGGIVITNHFSPSGYELLKGETHAEKVRSYFALIENMREMFKPFDIKVFYGTEVCAVPSKSDGYEEYMIYGISEKDMTDSKPLFTFTQKELFRFAEKRGLFMYQTHPFRDRVMTGDPRFMHGAESFNGHFHHYNHNDIAKEFCAKNGLIGMSGTDYHHEDQPITAGIYVPENVCTNEQLTEFIFQNKFKTIEDALTYERELRKYKENI
ncbi:MAG: hypothetical protein J5911_00610 [Clostridia bacterium]|nr:hypothetical protein [Clostridia bacterium]